MRRRIVALVVAMTVLVVLAFAIPLAVLIRNTVYSNAEKALSATANNLAIFINGRTSTPSTARLREYIAQQSHNRTARVTLPGGRTVGGSVPAIQTPTGGTPPAGGRPGVGGVPGNGSDFRQSPGSTMTVPGGQAAVIRIPNFTGSGQYLIEVYATDGQLHSGETPWWWLLGGASVGLLVIGVTAAELLTRRIVRPLVDTASTAQRLATGDIDARAPTTGPPEIADVGRSLNRLADRIDELIAEERETVADLSHRLRTPLTALRLDSEALQDPVEAERIGTHVGTLERMLTSIIRAARRPQREGRMPSCDATSVVSERTRFWSALAEDQRRVATIDLPGQPVPVRAAAEDLGAAVDALLENVIAHTPEGTAYAVRLGATERGARLEVADNGPGLPEAAPERGRSDRGSSGLGLDIARRCAESSGGWMTLGSSAGGGAQVVLELLAP